MYFLSYILRIILRYFQLSYFFYNCATYEMKVQKNAIFFFHSITYLVISFFLLKKYTLFYLTRTLIWWFLHSKDKRRPFTLFYFSAAGCLVWRFIRRQWYWCTRIISGRFAWGSIWSSSRTSRGRSPTWTEKKKLHVKCVCITRHTYWDKGKNQSKSSCS